MGAATPRTQTGVGRGPVGAAVVAVLAAVLAAVACAACGPSSSSAPPRSHPTPTTTTPVTSVPRRRPPAGTAVPAGFEPASADFVSATTGFALGIDAACPSATCVALARTTDGGATWVGLPAPAAAYAGHGTATPGATAVSEVRFADELDGWAFGPSLFATHDGGRTWQAVDLGGPVVSLATSDGVVDAVVSPCSGVTTCTGSLRLEQAPATGGAFTAVVTGPPVTTGSGVVRALSLSGPVGFVSLGPAEPGTADLYATGDLASGPPGWHPFPDPCASQGILSLASFTAPDTTTLYSLCSGGGAAGSSGKTVVVTRNGVTTVAGTAPLGGAGGTLTATAAGTLVIATASGASWLYRSTDGGRTWATAETFDDGGMGFADLAFVDATVGSVVHGVPGPPAGESTQLLRTTDAGATWQPLSIG